MDEAKFAQAVNEMAQSEEACSYIDTCLSGPLLPIVEILSRLMIENMSNENYVLRCVTLMGRVMTLKRTRFTINYHIWLESENLVMIHQALTTAFNCPKKEVRDGAARCLAKAAEHEVPNGAWDNFFPSLFEQAHNVAFGEYYVDGNLGVIIEMEKNRMYVPGKGVVKMIGPDFDDYDLVIENVYNTMYGFISDAETPLTVRRSSFEIFMTYFSHFERKLKEDEELRQNLVEVFLLNLQIEDNDIHITVIRCLVKLVTALYFQIGPQMDNIHEALMNEMEGVERQIIDAINFWVELADREYGIEATFRKFVEAHPDEELESRPLEYIRNYLPSIIPKLFELLSVDSINPEGDEEEAVYKSAQACLTSFSRVAPDATIDSVLEFFRDRIAEDEDDQRLRGLLALVSIDDPYAVELPPETYKALIDVLIQDANEDTSDLNRETSIFGLSKFIKDINDEVLFDQLLQVIQNNLDRTNGIIEECFQLLISMTKGSSYDDSINVIGRFSDAILAVMSNFFNSSKINDEMNIVSSFEAFNSIIKSLPAKYDTTSIFEGIIIPLLQSEKSSETKMQTTAMLLSSISTLLDRSISDPDSFPLNRFLPNTMELVIQSINESNGDINIVSEGLVCAEYLVNLSSDEEERRVISDAAESLLGIIYTCLHTENAQMVGHASLLLGDLVELEMVDKESLEDIFDTLRRIYNEQPIHTKLKILRSMADILDSIDTPKRAILHEVLMDIAVVVREGYDPMDPDSVALAFSSFEVAIDTYTVIFERIETDDDVVMKSHFGELIELFDSAAASPIPESIAADFVNFIRLVNSRYGAYLHEKLSEGSAKLILNNIAACSDEEVSQSARNLLQII